MSKELPSLLKIKSKPVLSVAILDQINIYPTSQKVLTACTLPSQSITAKMKHLSRQTLQPGAGLDDDCILSEFHPYCPECDQTYKREEVLKFIEHCKVGIEVKDASSQQHYTRRCKNPRTPGLVPCSASQ